MIKKLELTRDFRNTEVFSFVDNQLRSVNMAALHRLSQEPRQRPTLTLKTLTSSPRTSLVLLPRSTSTTERVLTPPQEGVTRTLSPLAARPGKASFGARLEAQQPLRKFS